MNLKKTLVLGASTNPSRYSFIAVNKLIHYGHEVIALGNKKGNIGSVPILNENILAENVNTISLYLNSSNQKAYYDYILSLKPKRIIFNPGTENDELTLLARAKGIDTIEACTLVMLSTGQY